MSGFIHWLEKMNKENTKVRAILRRSLALAPGTFPPAFPYVEPFLKNVDGRRREAFYLTAGLWAMHWKEGQSGEILPMGKACERLKRESNSESLEKRFIALLDADNDQLPHRLRQMISLLKDFTLDFESLLLDILRWDNDQKTIQIQWARDFYKELNTDSSANKETR